MKTDPNTGKWAIEGYRGEVGADGYIPKYSEKWESEGLTADYADLHFGEWRPFLIFNVADAAITIGVLILLIRALFVRDKQQPAAKPAPVENEVNA